MSPIRKIAGLSLGFGAALALGAVSCSDDASDPVTEIPCPVQVVLQAKCWRCHGEPLQNSAPVQLLTWDQIQAPLGTQAHVYEAMGRMIELGGMPPVSGTFIPAVEPLLDSERAVLLDWVAQGAPPGDQACP